MKLRGAAVLLLVLAVPACAGRKPPPPPPPPAPPALSPTPAPPPPLVPTSPPQAVPPPARALLTGTVTYLQRVALTPEALVQVELRDVTSPDVSSELIAKQVISKPGQVPVAFALEYDPTRIRPGRSYAVSARITDRGQLQFVTETRVSVLGGAAAAPVEIVVVPLR